MQIVFSGTDGAGKSTQISLLRNGVFSTKRVKIVWARGGYTPLFKSLKWVVKIFFSNGRFSKSKTTIEASHNIENNGYRNRFFKRKMFSKLWLNVSIFDLMIYYCLYVRFLKLSGYVVICDRYVEDTLMDFLYNHPLFFSEDMILWKLLKKLAPTPDVSFLLYVEPLISQQRAILKKDQFPDSNDVLEWRFNHYLDDKFFPENVYVKIDCDADIERVHKLIINKL